MLQCWVTVCDADTTLLQHWVKVSCLLGAPVSRPAKRQEAHGTFDNHEQINDTASLQPIYTPLFIYINNDLF